MTGVLIRTGVELPSGDGDVVLYESAEIKGKSWFDRTRRVIFINGIDNSPAEHAASAQALSTLQACPVIGVYNQTSGKLRDLWQCFTDKLKFAATVRGNGKHFDSHAKDLQSDYERAAAGNSALTKADFVRSAIAGNRATAQMFDVLRDRALQLWPVFAHSQGNLITCNALTAVALVDGVSAIAGREVHSFGSPNLNWPPGIRHLNHAFTFDFVAMLDYRFSFQNIKVGGIVAHAFAEYQKYDPEFVINRFRWGSFGLTLSLDEESLAHALVEMGANSPRLKAIFQRLLAAHSSDADDVALLYVQKTRQQGRQAQLEALAGDRPEGRQVIELLVRCLTGGKIRWVSADEQQAADYLQGLL